MVASRTRLGPEALIHPTATVSDCRLGRYTEVGERTQLIEVELGDYSYIVNDSDAIYSRIGKFCSIAAHVRINPGNHPTYRVSQHHFTYRAGDYFEGEDRDAEFFQWRRSHGVTIGHDVWIGHGAVILAGRTIGNGAVIGAGSIVSHDTPAYAVAAGVPARILKMRFPPDVAQQIEALGWWDWPHEKLKEALADFRALTPTAFLKKYQI
ncbi:MAG: chloramphenicol acetyltransferase [Hyphomicrobiales bacterium]|nr:chloramphenicol acetyltransferase [Hyphomicrobiales bacterium]